MTRIGLTGALLIAFLIAAGAPMIAFWLWPYSAAVQREVDEVRERHLLLARTTAESIDRHIETLTGAFGALAPLIARGGHATAGARLLRQMHFRHVCVVNRDDGVVVRAFIAEHAACPPAVPADRLAMLRELGDAPEGRMSRVVATPAGPLVFVARRVGELLVVGAVRTDFFLDLAATVTFGRRGHAAILDPEGRAIAHPRLDWAMEARDMRALEPVRRLAAGESGVGAFFSPAWGEEMVAGFARAPESGFGVMVSQPMSELRERAAAVTNAAFGVFGAGLALATAIALAFSSHLVRSVRRVADAARRMGGGDVGARVPADVVANALFEVATLGRAFNVMADRLEAQRARIVAAAGTDALTGLANRSGFLEQAARALAQAARDGDRCALYFLDVDRFKSINDGYGHTVGDAVLRELAARLRRIAGPGDVIGRQGGDEFLILQRKTGRRACAVTGARLLRALREPIRVGGMDLPVTVSAGVASFPRDGASVEMLVQHADQAMYEAKRSGRRFLRFFDANIRRRIDEQVVLKRELRRAIAEGAVSAEFQPIQRAGDGALVGFEALARWVSPTLGPVPPDRFIAAAEDGGLILPLGECVRREAFAFAASLRRAGLGRPVSVNVSPLELADADFARRLSGLFDKHELPPSAVVIEITERLFHETGPRQRAALEALRRRGLSFALDDFGAGFSSHGQLRAYPLDRLKISGQFVADMERDPRTRAMVRSMIDLGRSLGLIVTVEGVETEAQRSIVEALGADEVQGFWAHRPMDAAAALAMAREAGPLRRADAA